MGIISLGVGLLVGIGLSQFMSLFVSKIFEADLSKFIFTVSGKAIVKSVLYFFRDLYCSDDFEYMGNQSCQTYSFSDC